MVRGIPAKGLIPPNVFVCYVDKTHRYILDLHISTELVNEKSIYKYLS